jgi:hypothetical protein
VGSARAFGPAPPATKVFTRVFTRSPYETLPAEETVEGESAAITPDGAGPPRREGPPVWPRLVRWGNGLVGIGALALVVASAVRYAREHAAIDPATTGAELIGIVVGLAVLLLSATVAAFRPEQGETRRLAWTAGLGAAVLLLALGAVWYLIDADVRDEPEIGAQLLGEVDVDAFLAETRDPAAAASPSPIRVPTGVLVQSVEFLSANDVQVTGFVWQKYADAIPADVTRGFVLPEASDGAYQAAEAYRFEEDGVLVIGWHVDATLRQSFDYGRYPFDRQDIWLRLWHRDVERGVLLVPDFASYADMDPGALPGIEERFVYGGWEPEFSGFSYVRSPTTTTFGVDEDRRVAAPELYFNLGLKRAFLGPFFDHVVLTTAVAVLLFVVLVLTTSDEELQKRFGLNTAGVVGTASGLLFAVILKHNQIRSVVANRELAYLEILPFLLYGAILLVALNAILLASPLNLPPIEYRKNLLPVVAYWPLLLGVLLVATLLVFYG